MAQVAQSCLGGWDARKTYVDSVRAQKGIQNVLLLDSGDALPGTLFFQTFNSTMGSTYFSSLGYNATNIGSRDFDGGEEIFVNYVNEMTAGGVKVLSTTLNFTAAAGGTTYQSILKVATFTIQGIQVSVVGFTNPNIASETRLPNGVAVASEPTPQILSQIEQSKHVIMLSKSSTLDAEKSLLASSLGAYIDITLGSYNTEQMAAVGQNCAPGARICHRPYPQSLMFGSTPYIISTPPPLGMGITALDVEFDDDGILTNWTGTVTLFNRTTITPNSAFQQDLYDRKAVVIVSLGVIKGETPILLVGDGASADRPCRWTQCSMGSIVADAMAYYANADIGLIGGGSLRANITAGKFTLGQVLSTLPFLNNIASFQIRGTTLLKILNHGLRNLFISGSGRFLQTSGVKFQWNPALPATGDRVISMSVLNRNTGNYELLDTQKVYSVATTNFMYLGGDGYSLAGLPTETTNAAPYGALLTDALLDFLATKRNASQASYFDDLVSVARSERTNLTEAIPPSSPLSCIGAPPTIGSWNCIDGASTSNSTVVSGGSATIPSESIIITIILLLLL